MIDFRRNILICKELDKVENFEEAVHDMNEIWVLHHRFETKCPIYKPSMEELIDAGLYYDRLPEELIYLKRSEHSKIHCFYGNEKFGYKSGFIPWNKGIKYENYKCNNGNFKKGDIPWNKGKHIQGHPMSEETKEKIRISNIGKKHNISSEMKKKMCYGNTKGTHWYNNGKINKRCNECPNGFVEGRL